MTEPSRLRRAVGSVEKEIAPPLTRATRSKELAQVIGVTISVRKSAERFVKGGTARLWHLMNLPAGSDVRRLRELVADLDRQLRHLQHQLDAQSARQPRQGGPSRGSTDSVADIADAGRRADADQTRSAAQRPEGA